MNIYPYIRLSRPANLVIAVFSIFMGGFLSGSIHPLTNLMLACISGMLIMAGANSINDYFDLEIDRINKPKRPLPSGQMTPKTAKRFALMLFLTGIILAVPIGKASLGLALFSSLAVYAYSAWLKKTAVWGNITVAVISGLAFVYGGLAVGRIYPALIVGLFAMLFHWGREIIKDIEDIEGDRSHNLRTLPILKGEKAALLLATVVLSLLIVVTILPPVMKLFSPAYLYVIIPGVHLVLVLCLAACWYRTEKRTMHRVAVILKADMLVGLVAVYLGS